MLLPGQQAAVGAGFEGVGQPYGGSLGITGRPLHHQIEIGQAPPGILVDPVQQQIAHGPTHQGDRRPVRRRGQGLQQLGRHAGEIHPPKTWRRGGGRPQTGANSAHPV